MTKRKQFIEKCKKYLNYLALKVSVMSDKELAEFADRKLECGYCIFDNADCYGVCEDKIGKYLKEHGNEEVEE